MPCDALIFFFFPVVDHGSPLSAGSRCALPQPGCFFPKQVSGACHRGADSVSWPRSCRRRKQALFAPLVCFPSCRDTPGIPRVLPIDQVVFCLQGKAAVEVLWGCLQRSGHLGQCLWPISTAPAPRRVQGQGVSVHPEPCHRPLCGTRLLFSSWAACRARQAPAAHSPPRGIAGILAFPPPKWHQREQQQAEDGVPEQQEPPELPRDFSSHKVQEITGRAAFCTSPSELGCSATAFGLEPCEAADSRSAHSLLCPVVTAVKPQLLAQCPLRRSLALVQGLTAQRSQGSTGQRNPSGTHTTKTPLVLVLLFQEEAWGRGLSFFFSG